MADFSCLAVVPLKQRVIDIIEEKILTGQLTCGTRLPSEAELSKTFGVGRRTIREALHILQARGLVEIQQGKGAFVIRNDYDNYLSALSSNISNYLLSNKGKIENVLEIREILETYALKVCIERRNESLPKILRKNLEVQKKALSLQDSDLYHRAHLEFHGLLIQGVENPIIEKVYEQIIRLIEDIVFFYANVPAQMERSIAEHEGILISLERGDLSLSVRNMVTHLSRAYENFKKRQEQKLTV